MEYFLACILGFFLSFKGSQGLEKTLWDEE